MLGALGRSALGFRLRALRADARRVVVFAALSVTGFWRSAALAADGLLAGLTRDWGVLAQAAAPGSPALFAVSLRPVTALAALGRRVAGAGRRLTAAHLRFVARVDDRLLRAAA